MRLREKVAQFLVECVELWVALPLAAAGLRVSGSATGGRLYLGDRLLDRLVWKRIDGHFRL